MDEAQVIESLKVLTEPIVSVAGGAVEVAIPAIGDSVRWRAADAVRVQTYFGPTGDLAVEFVIRAEGEEWPLILTDYDVVFIPHADARMRSPFRYSIADIPPIVSYTEMERAAAWLLRSVSAGGELQVDRASAQLVMVRRFALGAIRFGLRPVRVIGGWTRAREVLGSDFHLGDFLPDEAWDDLAERARLESALPRPRMSPVEVREPNLQVRPEDFDREERRLRAIGFDEEFLALWRRHIPVSPRLFSDLLTYRIPGASVEVALYEDGAGAAGVRVRSGEALRAMMDLRFSVPERTMDIDELRIVEDARGAGLFQKLQFNADQLARRLGLGRLRVLASDVGGYAFAVGPPPRDRAMHAKVWGR